MVTPAYLRIQMQESTYDMLDIAIKLVGTPLVDLIQHLQVHLVEHAKVITIHGLTQELFDFLVELSFDLRHRDHFYLHLLDGLKVLDPIILEHDHKLINFCYFVLKGIEMPLHLLDPHAVLIIFAFFGPQDPVVVLVHRVLSHQGFSDAGVYLLVLFFLVHKLSIYLNL